MFEITACSSMLTSCPLEALGREGGCAGFYPVKSGTTDRFAVEPMVVGWLSKRLGPSLPYPAF